MINDRAVVVMPLIEMIFKGAGHWIFQKKTDQIQKGLMSFLVNSRLNHF